MNRFLVVAAVVIVLLGAPVSAQPSTSVANSPQMEQGTSSSASLGLMSRFEFWLSSQLLLLGLAVVSVEYLLLRGRRLHAESILRVFALTLIPVGTLFLITAGYDEKQIAPATTLFGTIAGYLLARGVPQEKVREGG